MAKDKDYRRLIHSRRWLMLRRDILTAHPLCENCQKTDRVALATEVHHRKPVESGINYAEKRRLMYDPGNLMALCHDCHVKIHTEMGRSGKIATQRRNAEQIAGVIKKFFDGWGG